MLEILPSFGPAAHRLAGKDMTENLAELGVVLFAEIEALETESPIRICVVRFQYAIGIETVHVIELAFAGIAEDVVRLGDPLE